MLGLVTNKTYDVVFKDESLKNIADDLYEKSENEFNKKYSSKYGGKYDNFIARDENREAIMDAIIKFDDFQAIELPNVYDFEENVTPDEVILDFLTIFNNNLEKDSRLDIYRGVKAEKLIVESVYKEIIELKKITYRKFEIISGNTESTVKIGKSRDEIKEVLSKLEEKNLILVDSFRGFGKTHFLKVIGESKECQKAFVTVYYMRHGIRNILDALQSEIKEEERVLVLVDDIENSNEELIELLRFSDVVKFTFKLIVTSQTYSIENVKRQLVKFGFVNCVDFLSLNKWKPSDLKELFNAYTDDKRTEDLDLIISKYPSPSLIKWIAFMKQGTNSDIEEMFQEQKFQLESDTFAALDERLTFDECQRLLFNLSCSLPLALSTNYIDLFQNKLKCCNEFEWVINKLFEAGILRKIGYNYRFYPDLIGDIYLSHSLSDDKFVGDLEFWFKESEETIINNISEARFISEFNIDDKLKKMIDTWMECKDYFSQSHALKMVNPIVKFVPESVINMMYVYFEYAKANKGERFKLTTDDFGPIILELWNCYPNIELVLEVVLILKNIGIEGMYSNYKIDGLISRMSSPAKNSTIRINELIDVVHSMVVNDVQDSVLIFEYMASEILKVGYEVTNPIVGGIQYGLHTLVISRETIEIRTKCLETMELIINEKKSYLNFKTIDTISRNIGLMSYSRNTHLDSELSRLVMSERQFIVGRLGDVLLNTEDVKIKILIEKLFVYWWAGQSEGTEKVTEYLNAFQVDELYLFVKYYVESDYRFIEFDEIEKDAPNDERWKWFVHEIMHDRSNMLDDSNRIAEKLSCKIKEVEALKDFLLEAGVLIEDIGLSWSSPQIINRWFVKCKDLFYEYFKLSLYKDVPEYLRSEIISSVIIKDDMVDISLIHTLLNESLTSIELDKLLNVLSNDNINSSDVISILKRIINEQSNISYGTLVHRLYFIFKDRGLEPINSLLMEIIDKEPEFRKLIDSLDFFVKQFIDKIQILQGFAILKDTILEKMLNLERFNYHDNSLFESLIIRSEDAINFVCSRIGSETISKYRVVPFDGFKFLEKYITSESELDILISKLVDIDKNSTTEIFSIHKVISNLLLKNNESGEILLKELLERYIKIEKVDNILFVLGNEILTSRSLGIYVKTLIYLSSKDKSTEAEKSIYLHRFPEGGYSRSIGSVSPQKVELKTLYERLYTMLPPGKLRIAVDKCISYIENDIEEDNIHDEEFLNPR